MSFVARRFFRVEWLPYMAYFIVASAVVLTLLFFRLGNLVGGPASPEIDSYKSASSLRQVLNNPLNVHYKLVQRAAVQIAGRPSALALRSASAIFGVLAVLSFYYVLKNWQTKRLAILGTALFATSPWFLHTARSGLPSVTQWLLIALAAYGAWLLRTKRHGLTAVIGAGLLAAIIYTPGLIWFVVAALIWQRRRLQKLLPTTRWPWLLLAGLIFLVGLLPLARALYENQNLVKGWLGIGNQLPSLSTFVFNIVRLPIRLFAKDSTAPSLWLSGLPILDLFTSAMMVMGVYAYRYQLKLDRARLLLGIFLLSSFLIALAGLVDVTILLPFIYVLATAGIALMIQQWFTVFPRNPLARSLGLGLIIIVITLSVAYNLSNYFIAWPQTPATKQAYAAQP